MILTLIVAIPCAWLGRKIERKRQESEAVLAIVKLGGEAVYDYNLDGTECPGPNWLRKLLGENFFAEVALANLSLGSANNDAAMDHLKPLTQLKNAVPRHANHRHGSYES